MDDLMISEAVKILNNISYCYTDKEKSALELAIKLLEREMDRTEHNIYSTLCVTDEIFNHKEKEYIYEQVAYRMMDELLKEHLIEFSEKADEGGPIFGNVTEIRGNIKVVKYKPEIKLKISEVE